MSWLQLQVWQAATRDIGMAPMRERPWLPIQHEDSITMTTNPNRLIYQFKVTLLEIEPAIWRRLQVPATFDLK